MSLSEQFASVDYLLIPPFYRMFSKEQCQRNLVRSMREELLAPFNRHSERIHNMAKFPQFDFNSSPEAWQVAARIEKSRGYVSNVMHTLGHSMKGVTQHMALGHFLRYQTMLTELQRELVICATVRKVEYAWTHHCGLLKQLGMSNTGITALRAGEVPVELSGDNAALCAYILELVQTDLSEETLARVKEHFSLEQIVDMSLLSIYYFGTGVLILAFEIPIEPDDVLQIEKMWQMQKA